MTEQLRLSLHIRLISVKTETVIDPPVIYWCCDNVFVGPAAFRVHLGRNHTPPFQCGQDGCVRDFLHRTSLFRHIRDDHIFEGDNDSASSLVSSSDGTSHLRENSNSNDSIGNDNIANDSVGNDSNGSVEENEPIDLKKAAADIILDLRSTGGVTSALIERFQEACTTIIDNVTATQRQTVKRFLDSNLNLTDTNEAQDLLRELAVENPFQHIRTLKQQLNYFSREMGLVLPVPHFIGYRSEWKLDPATNQYEVTQSSMVFQYIPIIETLKLILSNPRLRYLIENEKKSEDDVLRSYLDGTRAKSNTLIQEQPNVIRLQIYTGDLEVVNALGSRTVVHKLTALYFSIQNFPPAEASQLSSIYLLGLAYTEDVKTQNGYENFFTPFFKI
ncbi:Transcription factor IIIA [Frankliniella fusca]|uniref:Transcription factor IIIA n=1 Tax=Frankliniella fusca TaxID=407009 RepID=A0AAE1GYV5_9NEOP|nr:Transcription factor IIIA [Frankliniella fusca]